MHKTGDDQTEFKLPSRQQTAKNVFASFSLKLLLGFSSLVVTGILARVYPLEVVGLWALVAGLLNYLSLADFGVSSALPRAIPALQVNNRHGGPGSAIVTACCVSLAMSLVLLAVAVPGSALLTDVYQFAPDLADTASFLFLAAFLAAAILLPLRLGVGVLSAVHRYDLAYLVDGLVALVKVAVVAVLVLVLSVDILTVGAFLLSVPLLAAALQTGLSWRFVRPALPKRSEFTKQLLALLSLAVASVLISFSVATFTQGPAMVAATLSGPETAATIALPILLGTSLLALVRSSAGFLTPVASGLAEKQDMARVTRLYVVTTIAFTALAGGLTAVMVIAAPYILELWLGGDNQPPEALDTMADILLIYVAANALATPGMTARIVMMSTSRHWQASVVEVSMAILALGLGALLYHLNYGLVGLATGLAAIILLRGWVVLPLLLARRCGCSVFWLLRVSMLRPLLATLACGGFALLLKVFLAPSGILEAALVIVLVGLLWLAAIGFGIATRQQRYQVSAYVTRRLGFSSNLPS